MSSWDSITVHSVPLRTQLYVIQKTRRNVRSRTCDGHGRAQPIIHRTVQ